MSEKHFEPSPSRLARAKREGDVAISQELCSAVALACALAGCAAILAPLGAFARQGILEASSGRTPISATLGIVVCMAAPALLAAGGSALAAIAQMGGVHFVMPKCDLKRLEPAENVKRMFSRESAITAVRSFAAFLCAALALAPVARAVFGAALHACAAPLLASAAWNGALHAALAACVVGAVFSSIDFGVQQARRRRRLRMSHDELRRELKDSDGDPLARGRRKAMHRAMTRGSVTRVKEAACVITNPTHIAVALEYRPPLVSVPRVLVSAAGEGAAEVRRLAHEHAVPIVENVPLARDLWARCKPGDVIPGETFVAVAEIVAALSRPGASK